MTEPHPMPRTKKTTTPSNSPKNIPTVPEAEWPYRVPENWRWVRLGTIVKIKRGASPRPIKNYIIDNDYGINWIKIGDTDSGKYITSVKEKITKEGAEKSRLLHPGDFILSNSMSFGRPYILRIDGCIHDGWIAMSNYEKSVSSGFLYEILSSNLVQNYWKMKANNGGAMTNLNSDIVKDTIIPIPSLAEQERIVGILDTFTASIENLKEQIAQRRKQYEYYRDQLLDLEGKEGVEMKTIIDVAKSYTGLTYKPENVSGSGTLVLRSSNIDEDKLSFEDNIYVQMEIPERAIVRENDILVCVRNGSKRLVGKSAMITKEAEGMAFGAFMTVLRPTNINSKYLFYIWQSAKVKKQYKGVEAMPIAQITAKDFQRIIIPLPSLSEQERIVSILDTFEASIANSEAQLKEREKQYEYYRNELLTFE